MARLRILFTQGFSMLARLLLSLTCGHFPP